MIKTNVFGDEVPKESMHYTCTASITIDSVENGKKELSTSLFKRM